MSIARQIVRRVLTACNEDILDNLDYFTSLCRKFVQHKKKNKVEQKHRFTTWLKLLHMMIHVSESREVLKAALCCGVELISLTTQSRDLWWWKVYIVKRNCLPNKYQTIVFSNFVVNLSGLISGSRTQRWIYLPFWYWQTTWYIGVWWCTNTYYG